MNPILNAVGRPFASCCLALLLGSWPCGLARAGGELIVLGHDALAPPLRALPGAAGRPERGGPRHRLQSRDVLPGGHARFGLTVARRSSGPASLVRAVEPPCFRDAVGNVVEGVALRASWVQVWAQRDSYDHAVPLQPAAELLWRHGEEPEARPDSARLLPLSQAAAPVARIPAGGWVSLFVKVSVAAEVPPGLYRAELVLASGADRQTLPLRVKVLPALEEAPLEPALVFVRGRLVGPEEAPSWPELVTEGVLLRDLRWLREIGFTHVTSYERLGSPKARRWDELAALAGFSEDVTHVGWAPQGEASALLALRGQELQEHLQRGSGDARELFFAWDEPEGAEVELARLRASVIRRAGGLTTAAVQTVTGRLLADALDVPMFDNYLSSREDFVAAVRACRAAGTEPWQYWQSWLESPRLVRWNAGFRQLDEPTRGQVAYAFAQVIGKPWDDADGKDMLMAYPHDSGALVATLEAEAAQAGLEDLRIWRAGLLLVQGLRARGFEAPSLSRLARELDRARRRWSAERNGHWGNLKWTDYIAAAEGEGPPAVALSRTRARILSAIASVQREAGKDRELK